MSKTHTIPSSTFAKFDLADHIEEIPQEYLRMQVAQSYAWRIDTMITSAARTLFKLVKDELRTSELDSAADMNNALAEQAFAEQAFHDIGSDSLGPVRTINELLDLRPRAHAIARACTVSVLDWKGVPRFYEEPDVLSLFDKVGTMRPKADTLAKMRRNAERRAAANATGVEAKELAQKLYDRKVGRERNRLAAMGEAMKEQTGALRMMFDLAMKYRPENMKQCEFFNIGMESQRTLLLNAISACERSEDWSESDSSITDKECDDICITSDLTIGHLKKVLASPRFNSGVDASAASNAYSQMLTQRNEKERARAAEDAAKDKAITEAKAKRSAAAAKAAATRQAKAIALKAQPVITAPVYDPSVKLADMASDTI